MPTYVYKCDSCGAQFEQFQSFKDEPLRTCPACASAIRRVFQPVGIVFKGSGWYVTDSRKSSSATVGDDAPAKSETATTDKSETAGAAKSDTASGSTDSTAGGSASAPSTSTASGSATTSTTA